MLKWAFHCIFKLCCFSSPVETISSLHQPGQCLCISHQVALRYSPAQHLQRHGDPVQGWLLHLPLQHRDEEWLVSSVAFLCVEQISSEYYYFTTCFFAFFFNVSVQTQLPVWSWCRRCLCLATSLTQPSWSLSLWPLCAQKLVLHWKPHSRCRNANQNTQTHTHGLYSRSATGSFMLCVSLSGLHGRKHHVESGWPVDHAAERPLRSTGTREGDTCQQQEGGEILLLHLQCLTQ